MLSQSKYLVAALGSSLLVACSGGGGGGSSAPAAPTVSLASPALAKYEGVWRQDCVNHMRLSNTLTATNGNTFTVTPKEEHYANADCTGAVVATGSYGTPQETVQYGTTVPNASVKMLNGELITADVDPASSVLATAIFTFTGTGVRSSYETRDPATNRITATVTFIEYPDRTVVPVTRVALDGSTTQGGLLLRNAELLTLVPMTPSATDFQVSHRFFR